NSDLAPVALFDRRQGRQVALDARGELVRGDVVVLLGRDDAQVAPAAGPRPPPHAERAAALGETRPFSTDHDEDGGSEQADEPPAHGTGLYPAAPPGRGTFADPLRLGGERHEL